MEWPRGLTGLDAAVRTARAFTAISTAGPIAADEVDPQPADDDVLLL